MKNQGTRQSHGYHTRITLVTFLLSWMAVLLGVPVTQAATVGPAFTYQGNLSEGGAPANGLYDFRFTLHAGELGSAIGKTITNSPVVVTQGHFTVLLDFGPDAFTGAERWLQIGVRTNGSEASFTTLAPRQAISATPYATFAVNANGVVGSIDASSIQSGTLASVRLNTNVALLNAQQAFNERNTFNAAVVINPNGEASPLKIVGGSVVPHLSVSSDTNSTSGAVFSLDTIGQPGGNAYFLRVAGAGDDDAGKLIIGNETTRRNLLTFSTNHFVGINQDAPTNRLHVNGKVSASSFVGSGAELTDLTADAIGSGTISSARLNTNVALLTRNNQRFTGNNRFEGSVTSGTSSSDNVVLGVFGDPDRGAISLKDENNTTAVNLRVTATGGEIYANNPAGEKRAFMSADNDGAGKLFTYGTNGQLNITLGTGADADYGGIFTRDPAGRSTAGLSSEVSGGRIEARNSAGEERASMFVNGEGTGEISLRGTNGNLNVFMTKTSNPDHGFVGVYGSSGNPKASMHVADDGKGWIITDAIQINGGADIAEPFQVRPSDFDLGHRIEPGMLVAIDPDRAGELRLSSQAYDRTVAGIISGAGGVNTGMTLQQKGTLADGDHPVALTGRVWCYGDAGAGAIRPGDLLTTSDVPGHAMKVTDHARAQGAIVGKAMTRLEHGRGLVLVLVSLQ